MRNRTKRDRAHRKRERRRGDGWRQTMKEYGTVAGPDAQSGPDFKNSPSADPESSVTPARTNGKDQLTTSGKDHRGDYTS
jgi:hypothetical protein